LSGQKLQKEEIKQTNSPDKQAGIDYPYMCLKRHCLRQGHLVKTV
jgi:hypothetical protein